MTRNDHDDNIPIRHLCPLPHHGHAVTIHPPATICDHHTDTIRRRITDTRRLWDHVTDLTDTARNGGGTPGGTKSVPPTRLDLIALTDPHTHPGGDIPNAHTILTTIANWIADQRRLNPAANPAAALDLIATHYLALTDYPYPHEMWTDLRRLHGYLRRLAGEHPRELATPCDAPHLDPQHHGPCGGTVWSTGRQEGTMAACQDCGATITDTALTLAAMQRHNAEQRFTATHIPIDTA